jgi:ADP-ribosyl-[dinitrogen reductase] hydrolase
MAVGDALGLPAEGLSATRRKKLFGEICGHRLFFGRGIVSDDTEHALLTLAAWESSGGNPERFERALRRNLKLWLLTLSPGIGLATLRACARMWLGVRNPGVFSAGNGAAMRAPILGALGVPREVVDRSSRLTHTDPRTLSGVWKITEATAGRWPQESIDAVECGQSAEAFCARLGCAGYVSGFIEHTVPVALFVSYAHRDDFSKAVLTAIALGGDTDTVAALVGGIVGAQVGLKAIPEQWRRGILGTTPDRASVLQMALTHLLLFPVVLVHVLCRMLQRRLPCRGGRCD